MGLVNALVTIIPLRQEAVELLLHQVLFAFQDGAGLGRINKKIPVILAGIPILIDAELGGLDRGEAAIIVVGVEIAEKYDLMRFQGNLFGALAIEPATG